MSCQHSCEGGECWATLARLNTTMTVQASRYNGSLQSDAAHAHVRVLQRRQICMIQMMFEQGPSMPAVSPAAPAGCLQVERLCPMSCFQVNTPRSLSCLVPPVCLCGRYRPGEILASSPLCIHTQPDHVQSLRAVFCFAYNLVSSNERSSTHFHECRQLRYQQLGVLFEVLQVMSQRSCYNTAVMTSYNSVFMAGSVHVGRDCITAAQAGCQKPGLPGFQTRLPKPKIHRSCAWDCAESSSLTQARV